MYRVVINDYDNGKESAKHFMSRVEAVKECWRQNINFHVALYVKVNGVWEFLPFWLEA